MGESKDHRISEALIGMEAARIFKCNIEDKQIKLKTTPTFNFCPYCGDELRKLI